MYVLFSIIVLLVSGVFSHACSKLTYFRFFAVTSLHENSATYATLLLINSWNLQHFKVEEDKKIFCFEFLIIFPTHAVKPHFDIFKNGIATFDCIISSIKKHAPLSAHVSKLIRMLTINEVLLQQYLLNESVC